MNLNIPKPFVRDKNKKGKDWIVWKRNFLMYLRLTENNRKLNKQEQVFLLINIMGDEGQKSIETMSFAFEEDKEDINILIKKFDEIFIPMVNEIEERYNFFSRKKQDSESIDNYVMDLQEKAANCNFNDKINDFIRDMIILNMEKHLQKRLLQQELSLNEVISLYKQYSIDMERTKDIFNNSNLLENSRSSSSADTNDFISKATKESSRIKSVCWRCGTSHPPRACPAWGKRCEDCNELHHLTDNCKKIPQGSSQNYFCKKCGTSHAYRQCPAYGVTCTKCLKKNHFNSQCKNEDACAVNYIDKCDWCGSKHLPDECPHDEVCPKCDEYPHNMCFQCRENPHMNNCIFKELVTLPVLNNADRKNDLQLTKCVWCETVHHPEALCPHDATCTSCHEYPHKVCFHGRQNPHTELCIYKNLIKLPNS